MLNECVKSENVYNLLINAIKLNHISHAYLIDERKGGKNINSFLKQIQLEENDFSLLEQNPNYKREHYRNEIDCLGNENNCLYKS